MQVTTYQIDSSTDQPKTIDVFGDAEIIDVSVNEYDQNIILHVMQNPSGAVYKKFIQLALDNQEIPDNGSAQRRYIGMVLLNKGYIYVFEVFSNYKY